MKVSTATLTKGYMIQQFKIDKSKFILQYHLTKRKNKKGWQD